MKTMLKCNINDEIITLVTALIKRVEKNSNLVAERDPHLKFQIAYSGFQNFSSKPGGSVTTITLRKKIVGEISKQNKTMSFVWNERQIDEFLNLIILSYFIDGASYYICYRRMFNQNIEIEEKYYTSNKELIPEIISQSKAALQQLKDFLIHILTEIYAHIRKQKTILVLPIYDTFMRIRDTIDESKAIFKTDHITMGTGDFILKELTKLGVSDITSKILTDSWKNMRDEQPSLLIILKKQYGTLPRILIKEEEFLSLTMNLLGVSALKNLHQVRISATSSLAPWTPSPIEGTYKIFPLFSEFNYCEPMYMSWGISEASRLFEKKSKDVKVPTYYINNSFHINLFRPEICAYKSPIDKLVLKDLEFMYNSIKERATFRNNIRVACEFLIQATRTHEPIQKIIFITVTLDSLTGCRDTQLGTLTQKFSKRCSSLIYRYFLDHKTELPHKYKDDTKKKLNIYFYNLYKLRSDIVHGRIKEIDSTIITEGLKLSALGIYQSIFEINKSNYTKRKDFLDMLDSQV